MCTAVGEFCKLYLGSAYELALRSDVYAPDQKSAVAILSSDSHPGNDRAAERIKQCEEFLCDGQRRIGYIDDIIIPDRKLLGQ